MQAGLHASIGAVQWVTAGYLLPLAALLIVATHAAFGTGHLDDGYLGQVYARLEVGVPVAPWSRGPVDDLASALRGMNGKAELLQQALHADRSETRGEGQLLSWRP